MFRGGRSRYLRLVPLLSLLLALAPTTALSHCDTLDGPVAAAALKALEKGDVSPVLMWIQADSEEEVRSAFQNALAVRSQSAAARELADRFFVETVVRVHRAGEGVGFTGLKPAGVEIEPGIAAADAALSSGSVEALVRLVDERSGTGIRRRFARVLAAQKQAPESVEAGRAYVAAYVDFIHYVERLYEAAEHPAGHAHDAHAATDHP